MFREGGNTTAIVSGGRRKVHTTFDGEPCAMRNVGSMTVQSLLESSTMHGSMGCMVGRHMGCMGCVGDFSMFRG